MMQRRRFFRALLGAPVLGAVAAVPAKPNLVIARGQVPTCACGFEFEVHRAYLESDMDAGLFGTITADREHPWDEYMSCGNSRCMHYRVPLAIPSVVLAPADPRMVAAVKEELARQAEAERQFKREREVRDKAMREWSQPELKRYTAAQYSVGCKVPIEEFRSSAPHAWSLLKAR